MSNAIFPALAGIYAQKRSPTFDTTISGAKTGPEYRVAERVARWRHALKIAFARPWCAEDAILHSFFLARRGRLDSFLFRDPWDYSVTAHGFGVGDGSSTKFPLQRTLGGTTTDVLGTWDTYMARRTNLLPRSQDFGAAAWTKNSASVASADTIAPDGTLTADTVSFPVVTSIVQIVTVSGIVIGNTLALAVWLKGAAGGTLRIGIGTTGGTSETAYRTITLTGAWQRESVTLPIANASHTGFTVSIARNASGDATAVKAWGAQVEKAAASTSYIPTTSAAASADPPFWTADQTTGALVGPASGSSFEAVTEPEWGSITLYKDAVALAPGADFTFSATGLVTMASAPADGASLTWTGKFYKRVRFEDDEPGLEWDEGIWGGEVGLITVV